MIQRILLLSVLVWGTIVLPTYAQQANPAQLDLTDCITLARLHSPLVNIARATTTLARSGLVHSWSAVLPQIRASTSYSEIGGGRGDIYYAGESLSREGYSTDLSVSQILFDLSTWGSVAQSHWNVRSSSSDMEAVLATVLLDVTEKYYMVLKSQGLVQIAEAALRQSEENLRRVHALRELGSVSRADLLVAKVARGERELDLIQARKEADLALVDLYAAMGLPHDDHVEVIEDLALVELEIPSLEGLVDKALGLRPELEKVRNEERASIAEKVSAWGQWLPTLSLSGSYGYTGTDFPRRDLWDEGSDWTLGVSASLGLFTGFSRWGNIKAAEANVQIARAEITRLELEVARQVRQAHAELKQAVESYILTEENLEAAIESHRAARERYLLGAAPILELMDAEVTLTRARSARVQALYDCKISWSRLHRALGEPL